MIKKNLYSFSLSRWMIIVLLLTLSVLSCSFADSPAEASLHEVFNALQEIREEFVKEVDPLLLIDGVKNGMVDYLNKKKLNYIPFTYSYDKNRSLEANMRSFETAYKKVLNTAGSRLNRNDLIYHGLKGMITVMENKYSDKYAQAFTPGEYREMQEDLDSKDFSGIGIYMDVNNKIDLPFVVEPFKDSPAFKAGLKSGDIILKINGVSTRGMNIEKVSARIKGPVKTTVVLHIKRPGQKKSFDLKIVRDTVHSSSVDYKLIDNVGYIKIRYFGENTSGDFNEAMDSFSKSNVKSLIVDLRNNGGGYVHSARSVASIFIPKDSLVTSIKNYRKETLDKCMSEETRYKPLPLVVLINRHSASASELLAGCVQDHKAGYIVGEKSFGKGSVQTIHTLSSGGAIKFTTAHYLTPNGRDINHKGIVPDQIIKMDPARIGSEGDLQLMAALRKARQMAISMK